MDCWLGAEAVEAETATCRQEVDERLAAEKVVSWVRWVEAREEEEEAKWM